MAVPIGRVLVVDDNPGDARLAAWALAHEPDGPVASERADRVASALERLAEGGFSAVLLDLGLPDSRGTDGVERLRSAAPTVPVVVLSGAEEPERVRRALAAGAQDYLVKGIFPPGRLTATLRRAIARQRLEGELGEGLDIGSVLTAAEKAGEPAAYVPPSGPALATPGFRRRAVGESASDTELTQWIAGAVPGADGPPPIRPELTVRPISGGDRPALLVWWVGGEGPPPPRDSRDPRDPIDTDAWHQLEEMGAGDAGFVPALVAAFLEEAPRLERSVKDAARRGDAEAIAHGAHTLKSACAQVGALALARRWADVERRAEQGTPGAWEDELGPIFGESRAVEVALRARTKKR